MDVNEWIDILSSWGSLLCIFNILGNILLSFFLLVISILFLSTIVFSICSKSVEKVAVKEGLDKVFRNAGFEFRQPGCSACLAMNEDKIPDQKYCISTSNRNFEGRQGPGARTFLASPATAAAAAINGFISDIRDN